MMPSETLSIMDLLEKSTPILIIACFGGLVLFCLKMVEHFNRPEEDKFTTGRYFAFLVFLFITLPALGGAVVAIYLINGDKISPILSFQVGLTSPAIVQSLIIAAANNLSRQKVHTTSNQ